MKYTLTDKCKALNNYAYSAILYRIRALKDFGDVKAGDLGGWVQSEKNLSQDDNISWIYDESSAHGNAKVFQNATLHQYAEIGDSAKIFGNASVEWKALVCGDAHIFENARISGNAKIYGNAIAYCDARITDYAEIFDYAEIYGKAQIYDEAVIKGKAEIGGNAIICGNAYICDRAFIDKCSNYTVITTAINNKNMTVFTFFRLYNNKIYMCTKRNIDYDGYFGVTDDFKVIMSMLESSELIEKYLNIISFAESQIYI